MSEKKMEKLQRLNLQEQNAWRHYQQTRDVASLKIVLNCVKLRAELIDTSYKRYTQALENHK